MPQQSDQMQESLQHVLNRETAAGGRGDAGTEVKSGFKRSHVQWCASTWTGTEQPGEPSKRAARDKRFEAEKEELAVQQESALAAAGEKHAAEKQALQAEWEKAKAVMQTQHDAAKERIVGLEGDTEEQKHRIRQLEGEVGELTERGCR